MNKYGLSVIIPTRNEALLDFTIENVLRVAGVVPVEILVINDGGIALPESKYKEVKIHTFDKPIGLAYARDFALKEMAQYEQCFIIDAHMDFSYNSFEPLVSYLQENKNHLTCFKVRGLDSESKDWTNSEYYGADIQLCTFDARQGQGRLFPSKWTQSPAIREGWKAGKVQEVCGILGACYGINKTHYLETLGRPWNKNRGWGTSEQSISIPNWLLGGKSVLMPFDCAHYFKKAHEGHRINVRDIIYNQLKLMATVAPSPFKAKLENFLYEHCKLYSFVEWQQAQLQLEQLKVFEYTEFIKANQKRGFEDWIDYFKIENPFEEKE